MALNLSPEQEALLQNVKLPQGWQRPSFNLAPYPYYNYYVAPVWKQNLWGGSQFGSKYKYADKISSALVQPYNPLWETPLSGRGYKK